MNYGKEAGIGGAAVGGDSKSERYLEELREHCAFALGAFRELNSPSASRNTCEAGRKFCTEFRQISGIFWARNNKKQRKEIRQVLSITDESPFYSKSLPWLDSFLQEFSDRRNKAVNEVSGEALPDTCSYEVSTGIFTFNGKGYGFMPLFLAVRELYASLPLYGELKSCSEILQKDPENATALFQKAVLLDRAGRFEEALQMTGKVLEIVPDDYRVWYNRGVILGEMGRLEEALEAYEQTIKLEPAFEIAWDNKGVILARLGRYEEALESYSRVLGKNPGYAEAWAGKGSVLLTLGREEEALEAYSAALESRQDYLEALACKGTLLSGLGRFEEALDVYDRALESVAEEPGLWYNRGLVLSGMHRYEEALQSYNKALEIKPGFLPAQEAKLKALSGISREKRKAGE